jgi:hypothetical protein
MEFIGDLLALCTRPLARMVKAILPSPYCEKFEPDSNFGDFIGFGILVILLSLAIFIVASISTTEVKEQLEIDKCLDNGGKYNYQTNLCEHK